MITYDSKCYFLAQAFLEDVPELLKDELNIRRLAAAIQSTIEAFITARLSLPDVDLSSFGDHTS